MDVIILRKACARYMKVFLDLVDFNPFISTITLAQCVLTIFRKNFMLEKSLGICPSDNYSPHGNQSLIGQKWLLWCDQQLGRRLKREYRLPCNLIIDGYDHSTRTCYEFMVIVFFISIFYLLINYSYYCYYNRDVYTMLMTHAFPIFNRIFRETLKTNDCI